MSKKYAVLWCASYKNSESLKTQMVDALRVGDEAWRVLDPMAADFEQTAYDYDGYVISGSARSVAEETEQPLVAQVMRFLRAIRARSRAPVVGICFGAQAIAKAYGGDVGANPSGRLRLGVETLSWTQAAKQRVPTQARLDVDIAQSHFESVRALPPDAMVLASSPTTDNEIFLIGGRYLGIQGHPEIDNATLKAVFLAFHQTELDDAALRAAQAEAERDLRAAPVLGLIRLLLQEGTI